jgi:ABC-type dipeptide/oligopeptide/nickel transport system permease component
MGQAHSVAGFILRRLLWTFPILWVVLTIVFFMMRSIGGDPFRHGPLLGLSNAGWVKYGDPQPPAIRRNQREKYGLDLPWYQQYGNYLKGVVTLDFGPSLSFRYMRVTDIIKQMVPRSVQLVLLAFAWAISSGFPSASWPRCGRGHFSTMPSASSPASASRCQAFSSPRCSSTTCR